MDNRCQRCGDEHQLSPAIDAVEQLVADHLPGTGFEELCEQLWLLELIVFVCKNNPNQAALCPTCRSPRL